MEDALDLLYGHISVPTGRVSLDSATLAYLKQMETAGLVTLREVPQAYWDSFLTRTQGLGTPFDVVATPKLLSIADSPSSKVQATNQTEPVTIRIKVQEAKVGTIVSETEYNGPLVTPGEKHRLVLGTYRAIPTAGTEVIPGQQPERTFRFRCVVRYSDFKKEWSVVAIDAGRIDPESWFTQNVK